MTTERSDRLNESHRASAEKFDYFVLGVTGAVVAYISQTFIPAKLSVSPNSLELAALLFLFLATFAGFRRIEKALALGGANYLYLRALEKRGSLAANFSSAPLINQETGEILAPDVVAAEIGVLNAEVPKWQTQLEKASAAALFWYRCRNRLLAAGFFALIGSKVWAAYV